MDIKKILTISLGNMKLGSIPSISLPPLLTCMTGAPCFKTCYAMKTIRLYKSAREAWYKNYIIYQHEPDLYKSILSEWFDKYSPEYFRWHVGGDVVDFNYVAMVFQLADKHKDTNFLLFTKKYDVFNDIMNDNKNLSIIFSAWPGLALPEYSSFPIAWFDDGTDDRIPENSFQCNNNCSDCKKCWEFKANESVTFKKH